MPFDPKRGADTSFGGYANPYAAQPANQNKKPNFLIFAVIGVLAVGVIAGVTIFAIKASNKQIENPGSSTVVNKSDYVEVEIFDVQE